MEVILLRYIKPRKPRGIKLDGTKSLDMCKDCHSFFCDFMYDSREWAAKKRDRHNRHVCVACNSNPCKCKSHKLSSPKLVLHNNKKKSK
jgi:hypothetical protein